MQIPFLPAPTAGRMVFLLLRLGCGERANPRTVAVRGLALVSKEQARLNHQDQLQLVEQSLDVMRKDVQRAMAKQNQRKAEVVLERVAGYLSVKEAAQLLGVSERTVYGYVESGKLPGARVGSIIVVEMESVCKYQRRAPGRLRTKMPVWRVPPKQNLQYLTSIAVQLRQGQSKRFEQKLREMRTAGKHLLPGTSARYIVRDQENPEEVLIVLVWRSVMMPPAEEREAALAALRADLTEILAWETAVYTEGQVILHA